MGGGLMKTIIQGILSVANGTGWLPWLFSIGLLVGCGEDPQQLFETAQFEEQQRNLPHAQALYERIIRDHPTTMQAEKARERLDALRTEGS